MARTMKSKQLAEMVREAREAAGLSSRGLATATGIDVSLVSRIESGEIVSPSPRKLQALAEVLEIAAADLYAAAGYPAPAGLPAMRVYLRAKYGVSDADAAELEAYFHRRIAKGKTQRGGTDAKRRRAT